MLTFRNTGNSIIEESCRWIRQSVLRKGQTTTNNKQTTNKQRRLLPRSEHCVTRRWHWQRNGHMGPSDRTTTSGSMGTTAVSTPPEPASSSIMKSMKPDWRKGSAQQAVARSRERQADLMVLLAASLWGARGGSEVSVGRNSGRFS